ncbi:MAG: hypothetical protein OXD50_04595 [Chloroflexi bacterium]|nr:hypothetical protein [Chloroflexota bacterium]
MADQPRKHVDFVSDIDIKVDPPNSEGNIRVTFSVPGMPPHEYGITPAKAQQLATDLNAAVHFGDKQT